jgi:hypothetical protein
LPDRRAAGPLYASPLHAARAALERAVSALTHAANQDCSMQKAVVDLTLAIADISAGLSFIDRHPEAATAPPPDRPDFTFPEPPGLLEGRAQEPPGTGRGARSRIALNNVATAFDAIARAPGGDLGGARTAVNDRIVLVARELIAGLAASNAAYRSGRRGPAVRQPCSSS